MDNRSFDVFDNNRIAQWIECCAGDRHAIGWSLHGREEKNPPRMVFYWTEPTNVVGFTRLPFRANAADIATIVERWLEEVPYEREPDHDGDNGKGFRIYNEAWGHVDGHYQAFMAVSPVWAMFGK